MKNRTFVLAVCSLFISTVALAKAEKKSPVAEAHKTHEKHDHKHGKACGHEAKVHENHTEYIHDGHAHIQHAGRTVAAKEGQGSGGEEHYDECSPAK